MYYLMCKDDIRASFDLIHKGSYFADDVKVFGTLPYNCSVDNFTEWLSSRNTAKHREHLQKYLQSIKVDNLKGFLDLTHGTSLTDCFWVKSADDTATWGDVSLFTNEFDEVLQHLAFDGQGLYGVQLSSASPELSVNGQFPKCWIRENNQIKLLKRGLGFGSIKDLEPGCEALASNVFNKLSCGIHYDYLMFRNKATSSCNLFTSEDLSYVSYAKLQKPIDINTIFDFYKSIGCEEFFRKLMICDAITLNTDRHAGNFGVLCNSVTNEVITNAPGFDYNLSLFPYTTHDEFMRVEDLIRKQKPKLGDDFIEIARYFLTPKLKRELSELVYLDFKLPMVIGDFTEERIKFLNNIMKQQIRNIVSNKEPYYIQFKVEAMSNIGKYKLQYNISEDEFVADIPRLMKLLNVKHMKELEIAITQLL